MGCARACIRMLAFGELCTFSTIYALVLTADWTQHQLSAASGLCGMRR